MPYNEEQSVIEIKNLLKTVHRLRAPGGCPWDREQTHQSLRPFLIEETYETIEVLDQIKSPSDLKAPKLKHAFIEEWGDVLLQILLHAEIASEADSTISIAEIAQNLNEKLIRRHPHVFGETQVQGSNEVVKNWEQIKKEEKKSAGETPVMASVLDSVHPGLPPLPRTMKLISKVTKVGFQWPDLKGPVEKLEEEVRELKFELAELQTNSGQASPASANTGANTRTNTSINTSTNTGADHRDAAPLSKNAALAKIEGELGDVLFNVCNIAHFLKLDPEAALRSTIRKFESRFRHVEKRLHEKGSEPSKSNLAEMDLYWDEAKKIERS